MRGGDVGNALVDARDHHAISKPRRPRWTPSEDAKALLETIFTADSFPTFTVRNQLAEQLQIDARQVQIWFQNRRQRERLRTGQQQALEEKDALLAVDRSRSAWPAEGHAQPEAPLLTGVEHAPLARPDVACDVDLRDAGVNRLAEASLKAEDAAGGPSRLDGTALLSPSAGSDETARTSIVFSRAPAFSLAAPAAVLPAAPCPSFPPHALSALASAGTPAPSRTVELPGGGTVDLPSGAPPALRQMFDTPGGSRALQLAARSLLRNNPILQHPGAPCHTLLTSLANMHELGGAAVAPSTTSPIEDVKLLHGAAAEPGAAQHQRHPDAPPEPPLGAAGDAAPKGLLLPPRLPLRAVSLERGGASSEALEVLSSQFAR